MWPEGLAEAMKSHRFWTDYLFLTAPDFVHDDDVSWDIDLPLGTSHVLRLRVSLGYVSLMLVVAPAREVELGWDDEAHWHPHALRWSEIVAIRERLHAQRRESPRDAALALLLLFRFAPLVDDQEFADASVALAAPMSELAALSSKEQARALARVDFRRAGAVWVHEAGGWTISQVEPIPNRQPEVYSLRVPGGPFPFEAWRRLAGELGCYDRA
jgi:hypothetical protein